MSTSSRSINVNQIKEFSREILPALGFLLVKEIKEDGINHEMMQAPYTLLPSVVPMHCYQEALELQTHFQVLLCRVAHDHAFLQECLQNVVGVDDFTGRLWGMYEKLYKEGLLNPLTLLTPRMDYMFHLEEQQPNYNTTTTTSSTPPNNHPFLTYPHFPLHQPSLEKCQLKQIELNTIAASFLGFSQNLATYYRLVLRNFVDESLVDKVLPNTPCDGQAEALLSAWKAYDRPNSTILILVGGSEKNIYDQRLLELSASRLNERVKVIRRNPQQLQQHCRLDQDRRLFVDDMEVAVVYLRTWYMPEEDEDMWTLRFMMEKSKAVMCPNLAYQLVGTKKVQQVLGNKGVLERFMGDAGVVEAMRKAFAEQYSLDQTTEGDAAIEMALKQPHKFVVKPQREGGGNNFYNKEITTLLSNIQHSKERCGYIMMDMISPLIIHNIPMVEGGDGGGGASSFVPMVSELGIYGYILANKGVPMVNKHTGHLLRTKRVGIEEGGVVTGYSVLDAPFLVG